MGKRSVVTEGQEIQLASELVVLGARLQVLEAETGLSRERLLKLYKEIKGESPPKGMLPFSADWFLTWQPNIHASVFVDIYRYITQHTALTGIHAIVKSYRLYLEHVAAHELEQVLSFTRAWTLIRYFDADMLRTTACTRCSGRFVVHTQDLHKNFVCGCCQPPSRAGKTRKARESVIAAAA
jgi:flagellar transcriptional activator FlhC